MTNTPLKYRLILNEHGFFNGLWIYLKFAVSALITSVLFSLFIYFSLRYPALSAFFVICIVAAAILLRRTKATYKRIGPLLWTIREGKIGLIFLNGITVISGDADLRHADLSYADLSEAYLSEAKLGNADLSHTDLRHAYLRGANLIHANLHHACLRYADLREARLGNAYLREADLSHANLRRADLRRADLRYAYLSEAKLGNTYLREADLSGAILSEADLSGADLSGALVEDTQFGSGIGLSEREKENLIQRGAFFADTPGDNVFSNAPTPAPRR